MEPADFFAFAAAFGGVAESRDATSRSPSSSPSDISFSVSTFAFFLEAVDLGAAAFGLAAVLVVFLAGAFGLVEVAAFLGTLALDFYRNE